MIALILFRLMLLFLLDAAAAGEGGGRGAKLIMNCHVVSLRLKCVTRIINMKIWAQQHRITTIQIHQLVSTFGSLQNENNYVITNRKIQKETKSRIYAKTTAN